MSEKPVSASMDVEKEGENLEYLMKRALLCNINNYSDFDIHE